LRFREGADEMNIKEKEGTDLKGHGRPPKMEVCVLTILRRNVRKQTREMIARSGSDVEKHYIREQKRGGGHLKG